MSADSIPTTTREAAIIAFELARVEKLLAAERTFRQLQRKEIAARERAEFVAAQSEARLIARAAFLRSEYQRLTGILSGPGISPRVSPGSQFRLPTGGFSLLQPHFLAAVDRFTPLELANGSFAIQVEIAGPKEAEEVVVALQRRFREFALLKFLARDDGAAAADGIVRWKSIVEVKAALVEAGIQPHINAIVSRLRIVLAPFGLAAHVQRDIPSGRLRFYLRSSQPATRRNPAPII